MGLFGDDRAWLEYLEWQELDKRTLRKINALIKDIMRSASDGIGKPEPLRHDLSGYWSRRIDHGNRIVYNAEDGVITIISCKGHYE